MYKGKWELKILIYSVVLDCLSKIDCLKQLLLQFIKLTDAHLLLKLNMQRKQTRRKERGDRKRKERKRSTGKRGEEKKREGKKTIG